MAVGIEVQTFFHGAMSPFEAACLRSFADHGHRVCVYAFDHATTPAFCVAKDAGEIIGADEVFCYRTGFGAGSVAAFSNLFRYALLAARGGWWIDTDLVCLRPDWPDGEVVVAWEDGERVGNAVLRLPAGHPLAVEGLARSRAAGREVFWGQTGPRLVTALAREAGLAPLPAPVFYPLHWADWLDLLDPARRDRLAQACCGSAALHLWNEKLRSHGFARRTAPPAGSYLNEVFARHGGLDGFDTADARAALLHVALVRERDALAGEVARLRERPSAA